MEAPREEKIDLAILHILSALMYISKEMTKEEEAILHQRIKERLLK